jgi:acetyltransferase-like isoleucine patch superfamily enzyme
VVTKSVEEFAVVAGVPARQLRTRSQGVVAPRMLAEPGSVGVP